MESSTSANNAEKKDLDIDGLFEQDLPFKPVTRGLGFHNEEDKVEGLNTLATRAKELERDLSNRAKTLNLKQLHQTGENRFLGELAPFYEPQKKKLGEEKLSVAEESGLKSHDEELVCAPLYLRVSAYFADLSILISVLAITFLSIFMTSGMSLISIRTEMSAGFLSATVLPLSFLFYVFYFSFFDKTKFSTPGKRIMGLQVVSEKGESITIYQSFLRSVYVLLFSVGLWIPLFASLQDKLSRTKVICR